MNERQKWIEAYMCILQHIAKVFVGWYWTKEDGTMTLEVSNLVETFMAMTTMHISPCIVRGCCPSPQEDTPSRTCKGCEKL